MNKFKIIVDINLVKILIISLILAILLKPITATAGPSDLNALPFSGTEIKLSWLGSENESFDIWKSTDGRHWAKVGNHSGNKGSLGNFFEFEYLINQGVMPYVNYFFVVTTKDTVSQYNYNFAGENISNEVVAFPPNKPSHGYFTTDTNLCANCHTPHRGQNPKLLTTATTFDACLSCHDGTGSKYNVSSGMVFHGGAYSESLNSLAGSFGEINRTQEDPDPIGLSRHSLNSLLSKAKGRVSASTVDMWGNKMTCASCHNPHGNGNYRSLRRKLPENPEQPIEVKGYAATDLATNKEKPYYIGGLTNFCAGCHGKFKANKGSTDTPDEEGFYRHAVDVSILDYAYGPLNTTLPLEGRDETNVSCISCHFAHGSNKLTDGQSFNLQRKDNGTCVSECHRRDKNSLE